MFFSISPKSGELVVLTAPKFRTLQSHRQLPNGVSVLLDTPSFGGEIRTGRYGMIWTDDIQILIGTRRDGYSVHQDGGKFVFNKTSETPDGVVSETREVDIPTGLGKVYILGFGYVEEAPNPLACTDPLRKVLLVNKLSGRVFRNQAPSDFLLKKSQLVATDGKVADGKIGRFTLLVLREKGPRNRYTVYTNCVPEAEGDLAGTLATLFAGPLPWSTETRY